jgi:hypothetical protein
VNDRAKINMLVGAGIFGLGLAVTGISHAGAQHGGQYIVVAYGALIFGGLQFLFGLAQSSSPEPEAIDLVAGTLAFFIRNPNAPSGNEIGVMEQFVQLSPEKVREIAVAVRREEDGLNGFLGRNNDRINPDVAAQIIRGVYAVVTAMAFAKAHRKR